MNKRTKFLLAIGVIATLVVGWQIAAYAGPIGTAQGFEDDDGNLVDNAAVTGIDWNSFADVFWQPSPTTTPTRQADKVVSGFTFKGIEDWRATTDDSAFASAKQDDECADVGTGKAPNKDDLRRIYLASTTGADGHTYLNLAWVRIPQNTTSSSAHIGFEFNQSETACPAGSDGLVERTEGDMLIVYDFAGGDAEPQISVRRWTTITDPNDPDFVDCEVGSNNPPCWSPATNLTASGFAEGAVNVGETATLDQLAPPALTSATGRSVDQNLGDSEFGEAGIDLTAAGIFPAGECVTFGNAFAVSRSSGNSENAAMKDLVGPADFTLSNCGSIKIIKQTDPRGLNQNFAFTSTLNADGSAAAPDQVCTQDTTPAAFTLNDTGNTGKTQGSTAPAQNSAGNTENCVNVPTGSYTVNEAAADPAGFSFDNLTCTRSGTGTSVTTSGKTANITLAGGGSVTCLYTNEQDGQIKIIKRTDPRGLNQNFSFTSNIPGGQSTCVQDATPANFTLNDNGNTTSDSAANTLTCTNVPTGSYTVNEAAADPAGFSFVDVECTSSGTGTSTTTSGKTANITLAAGGNVECVYTNEQQGQIKIIKRTDPRGLNQNFSFTSSNSPLAGTCSDATPAAFTLNDNGNTTSDSAANTLTCTNVPTGSYTVNEAAADPAGFSFVDVECTSSGTGTSTTTSGKTANITLAAGGNVECVYTNDQDLGAIKILKRSTKSGNPLVSNAGAVFSFDGQTVIDNNTPAAGDVPDEDPTVGEVCVSGLEAGDYTVNETSPPDGYGDAGQSDLTATAVPDTNCTDNQPAAEDAAIFTNPPLSDIQVRFRDAGSGETALDAAGITCTQVPDTGTGDTSTADTNNWDDTTTITDVEAPRSITCTIPIDP